MLFAKKFLYRILDKRTTKKAISNQVLTCCVKLSNFKLLCDVDIFYR